MLEELLRKEDAEHKKKNLEEKYGFIMSVNTEGRLNDMCNLGEGILEEGIEKGMEKGEILKLIALVCRKMQKGKNAEEIAEDLEEPRETIEKIYSAALKYNADESKRQEIYKEIS